MPSLRALPLKRRTTVGEMARWLGIPVTTVSNLSKKHLIWVSSHIKPVLADENKLARTEFCLWERGENGFHKEMHDRVHVDETRNRPAGTLEWKNKNVTAEICTECLFERVITDVMGKWPRDGDLRICIQQDNAPSHISPEEFREEWLLMKPVLEDAHGGGLDWDFYLCCQPPNSPDNNLDDLAHFVSAKADCWKNPGDNIDEMVERSVENFEACPRHKLNGGFLTLMTCMNDIMECRRCNDCKITHMNKEGLERDNDLPVSIPVSAAAANWDA
jgi:hypothetical protein